jgi:hypothetical protein
MSPEAGTAAWSPRRLGRRNKGRQEMRHQAVPHRSVRSLACLITATAILSAAPAAAHPATPAAPQKAAKASPFRPVSITPGAKSFYQSIWGVDNFLVRETASGNLIRFSYRVVDPKRAKPLGDKEVTPYLIGVRNHVMLQIPNLEQVGQLRQTGVAKAGEQFSMVFSNKGNLVKPGDRVDVIIGSFHADGLLVE